MNAHVDCITTQLSLHVPLFVSTELYVEASTAFSVDFLQYITYKFSQTKILFSTLKLVGDFHSYTSCCPLFERS